MYKKRFRYTVKTITVFSAILLSIFALLTHPEKAADGIKAGLTVLGENVIPSLFPFMVLSTYISGSDVIDILTGVLEKPAQKLFKTNGSALIAVLMGFLGGYPIGAKTTAEFYESGKLTENEARRLFCWCVNPNPAFVITCVGTFMLSNFKVGIILYVSCVLSSCVIGFCTRFFSDGKKAQNGKRTQKSRKNLFVESVGIGSDAMFSVCGWVLTFSAIASVTDVFIKNENFALFVKAISEVTIGCKYAVLKGLPLPTVAAVLGFGGFAVIFQTAPYIEKCKTELKTFICTRLLNASLSAFFCARLLNIFPQSTAVFSQIEIGGTVFPLSHGISATLLLLLMCIVFIFEVDNKRKVC